MFAVLFIGIGCSSCGDRDVLPGTPSGNKAGDIYVSSDSIKEKSVQEVKDSINVLKEKAEWLTSRLNDVSKEVKELSGKVDKMEAYNLINLIGWGLGLIGLIAAMAAIINTNRYKARLSEYRDESEKSKSGSVSAVKADRARGDYVREDWVTMSKFSKLESRVTHIEQREHSESKAAFCSSPGNEPCRPPATGVTPSPSSASSEPCRPPVTGVTPPASSASNESCQPTATGITPPSSASIESCPPPATVVPPAPDIKTAYFGPAIGGAEGTGYFKKLLESKEDARFSARITDQRAEFIPVVPLNAIISSDAMDLAVEFEGVSKSEATDMVVLKKGMAQQMGEKWIIVQKAVITLKR